mmetsp:Transcript_13826/g.34741  ORF Transcript_13826/g.34741 Transcript_13826/m.34741 type:complete len:261 (+) Transcript_13826:1266-2048(+)
MKGILFRLSALAASSGDRSSTKANFPETLQDVIGFPAITFNPTCSIAFPKNSRSIRSVISGVVLPTNSSRLIFSCSASKTDPTGNDCPVSCCQVCAGTCGPAYFEGRLTLRTAPKKGIPFIFSALFAISALTSSTKANFVFTLQFKIGVSCGPQIFTRRIAPLRNCKSNISLVPGGVLPTNNSLLIFSWAARCAFVAVANAGRVGRLGIEPYGMAGGRFPCIGYIDCWAPNPDGASRSRDLDRSRLLSSVAIMNGYCGLQ